MLFIVLLCSVVSVWGVVIFVFSVMLVVDGVLLWVLELDIGGLFIRSYHHTRCFQ